MDFALVSALRRHCQGVDILTLGEAELLAKADPEVLAYAQANQRILITRDAQMLDLAGSRRRAGVFIFRATAERAVLGELELVWEASDGAEWLSVVSWLPL